MGEGEPLNIQYIRFNPEHLAKGTTTRAELRNSKIRVGTQTPDTPSDERRLADPEILGQDGASALSTAAEVETTEPKHPGFLGTERGDLPRPVGGLTMPTRRIELWSFRLIGTQGHEIWLEFDGLVGFENGLREFLEEWTQVGLRPAGVCFSVYAQGRDFASIAQFGPDAPWVAVPLGSYLLLRVDHEHPFWGDREPKWVLVQPSNEPGGRPNLIAAVSDETPGQSEAVSDPLEGSAGF